MSTAPSTPPDASLSVVIPSFAPHDLDRVVEALRPLRPREIIVVDSSPEPPTLARSNGVRVIRLSRRALPGEARNVGARAASSDYLLFVDADVELAPRGLAFVQRFLRARPGRMAWGHYLVEPSAGFATALQNRILRYRFGERAANARVPYGQSSHVLIERALFEEVGGFDPTLRMREDTDFCIRASRLGHPTTVHEEFEARHLKRFGPLGLVLDYFVRTVHAVRVQVLHPARFLAASSQIGARWLAVWILGPLLPLLVGGALLAGEPGVAVAAGLAVLASPAFLCREVTGQLAPLDLLRALLLWPALGMAMAAATGVATIGGAAELTRRRLVGVADWLRTGARVLARNGTPVSVVHYLTSRCNLRCAHCYYLDRLGQTEPASEAAERTLREIGPQLWYAVGGGEPFLRRDLVEIHAAVQRHCRPKVLSIPTNGWAVGEVFERTLRMLEQTVHGQLVLQLSLDGPREVHDSLRGAGSFDRAVATYRRLEPLRELFPRLTLSIITVVTSRNAHVFPSFVDQLVRDFRPNQVNVNLHRDGARGPSRLPPETLEAYRAATERYQDHLAAGALARLGFLGERAMRVKEALQKELIYRVAAAGEHVAPCMAGTLSWVVWEDGRLAPCELLPDVVGIVGSEGPGLATLVRGRAARLLRRRIRDERCSCTWECAMSVNAFFSWPLTRRLIGRTVQAAFPRTPLAGGRAATSSFPPRSGP